MKILGNLVTPQRTYYGSLTYDGKNITSLEELGRERLDADFILPGFIDLHLHGLGNYTTEKGEEESLRGMAAFAPSTGVTRLCPTMASMPVDTTVTYLESINAIISSPEPNSAVIAGAHLEGPWLSLEFGGGMNPVYLREPDMEEAQKYIDIGKGNLKLVTLAPELPNGMEMISFLASHGIAVSCGHSACQPEMLQEAVDRGLTEMCHLYDAYDGAYAKEGVRQPSLIDMSLINDSLMKEIIMDGLHVPPALVVMARRAAGADHIIAITDALQGAGLKYGRFLDAGRYYVIREGEMGRLEDEPWSIVGSSLTMNRAFFNMTTRFGFTPSEASLALATNASRTLKLEGITGRLEKGLLADITIIGNDHITVKQCILAGKTIY